VSFTSGTWLFPRNLLWSIWILKTRVFQTMKFQANTCGLYTV